MFNDSNILGWIKVHLLIIMAIWAVFSNVSSLMETPTANDPRWYKLLFTVMHVVAQNVGRIISNTTFRGGIINDDKDSSAGSGGKASTDNTSSS